MAIKPNELYPSRTTAPNVNYPYGGAQDVVVQGDGTGTPWRSPVVNDLWGFLQALLDNAGVTPSGAADTAVASQYLTSLRTLFSNNYATEAALQAASLPDGVFAAVSENGWRIYKIQPATFTPGVGDVALNDGKIAEFIHSFDTRVAGISDLLQATLLDDEVYYIESYHGDGANSLVAYKYASTVARNTHNGGTIISPTATFPSDWNDEGQKAAWFDGSLLVGTGCFVLQYDEYVKIENFGAVGDGVINDSKAVLKALTSGKAIKGDPTKIYLVTEQLAVTNDLYLKDLTITGGWDTTSPITVSAITNILLLSGTTIVVDGLHIKNVNDGALRINNADYVSLNNIRTTDTAYGTLIYSCNTVFLNKIRIKNTRRYGISIQSLDNVSDNDNLQGSDIFVYNVLPGNGTGQDLHGIGLEVHNFVDECLLTNVRVRLAHSIGISISGCENGRVTNCFVKDTGYTAESASQLDYRSFAAIEVVDSDNAYIEGAILDFWQTGVRIDKSHHAVAKVQSYQNNNTVDSSNFRFIRFQGAANDFNNSSWACDFNGSTFRNNTTTLLEAIDIGTFGAYLTHQHRFENCRFYNAKLDVAAGISTDGVIIESSGLFDDGVTTNSLLDVVDLGAATLRNIKYIGLNSGTPAFGGCLVSSGSINAIKIINCEFVNVTNILSATSGALAELYLSNTILNNITNLYNGVVSSAFRLIGEGNAQLGTTNLTRLPVIRYGNSISGVSGKNGDQLWKTTMVAGTSPGWFYDGTTWQPIPSFMTLKGNWTPTLQDATLSDAEGQTYTTQLGFYNQIDNIIYFTGILTVTSIGTLTGAEQARIAGLPFIAENVVGKYHSVHSGRGTTLNLGAAVSVSGEVAPNEDYIRLNKWSATAGSTALTVSEFGATGTIIFSGQMTI